VAQRSGRRGKEELIVCFWEADLDVGGKPAGFYKREGAGGLSEPDRLGKGSPARAEGEKRTQQGVAIGRKEDQPLAFRKEKGANFCQPGKKVGKERPHPDQKQKRGEDKPKGTAPSAEETTIRAERVPSTLKMEGGKEITCPSFMRDAPAISRKGRSDAP